MVSLTRVVGYELVGPTAVGVRLAGAADTKTVSVVVSPNDFITDFSTFQTALRAAGLTQPIEHRALCDSWREKRHLLRKQLVDDDPWGCPKEIDATETDSSPDYWSMMLCLGEERACELVRKQRNTGTRARTVRTSSVSRSTPAGYAKNRLGKRGRTNRV